MATRETFGELMNIARRAERLGNTKLAAEAAQEARKFYAAYPHLVCEGREMPEPLKEQLERLASL